jgi:formate-dependent nitrite reductase cytochrome c552 subunit
LKCADCHNVATINTASGKGPAVNVLSCGGPGSGCHVTATADEGGALNFEVDQRNAKPTFQCTKCHVKEGKNPIPQSHLEALVKIKKQ